MMVHGLCLPGNAVHESDALSEIVEEEGSRDTLPIKPPALGPLKVPFDLTFA